MCPVLRLSSKPRQAIARDTCVGLQGMSAANTDGNAEFSNFMSTFGAVPVGGRNFFRLLQNNESVVLFPGGVREVRPVASSMVP